MWPRASWRKPPWARSSSVAASATPAIASGFSNWGACSKPQFRAVGQFPITAFTPHLPTALYFPSEVRYAYGVQRAITERKSDRAPMHERDLPWSRYTANWGKRFAQPKDDIKQTYAKWLRLRHSSGGIH